VVVVGGGFGGLSAVRTLRRAPVEVVLIDRRNFHLFQPLLYQVATGSLSDGEIASPLRAILARQANASVLLGEVVAIDAEARRLRHVGPDGEEATLGYDSLIVAAGASHAYFGHDAWEQHAPGLKTVEDALEVRRRILGAFELAEREHDPGRRARWLTFVVVGGGPTGVELAGQIGEIARDIVPHDYRSIGRQEVRIMLVEMAEHVLASYGERLATRAERDLARLGVEVRTRASVTDIAEGRVRIDADGSVETVEASTVIWAAGVAASPLGRLLGKATGAEVDRAGRVTVGPDLTLPGHPELFAIGDMVRVSDAQGGIQPLPGVAQPAIQEGRFAAAVISARLRGRKPPAAFRYRDKGSLATIGRSAAVADIHGVRFAGRAAWVTWLVVHIFFLVGLQNRLIVFLRWTASFLTHGRDARLILERQAAEDTRAVDRVEGGH
jgi:NADH dehydrogenase